MEIQLQELIDKIKHDGVEAAESEAKNILEAAKAEADKIIGDARAAADKIISDARSENEKIVKASEDAIRQAGRNLLISFRESVSRELKAVIGEQVCAVYSSESFSKLVIGAVESWANHPDTDELTVLLNTDDLKAMEEGMLAALKAKMLDGVTLKPNDNFDGGFRISVNGDGAYYDYSADAVVDMLTKYLSPKVAQLLKEAE